MFILVQSQAYSGNMNMFVLELQTSFQFFYWISDLNYGNMNIQKKKYIASKRNTNKYTNIVDFDYIIKIKLRILRY